MNDESDEPVVKPEPLLAYKGFNADWTCRGVQYELGKTYLAVAAELCQRGFHACENPFDVWSYYGPVDARYAAVSLRGATHRDGVTDGGHEHVEEDLALEGGH